MYNNIIKSVFIVLKNILLYGGGGGARALNSIIIFFAVFFSFFLSFARARDRCTMGSDVYNIIINAVHTHTYTWKG